ncbi:hypothetical protein GQX74_013312 [Glossina fuscipes]|nr:hypothetical protein GQX74_013312 [Glossina fuscipes]
MQVQACRSVSSIAEREYLKWHNAVDMPNNPYAPEALKKRINGSQERCMDLPNISPGKEANPLEHITKQKLNDETDNKREIEYKRYSRDYYINNVSKSNESPSKSGSAEQYTEVNLTKQATENHTYTDTQRLYNDCHWTLAAPVRRSCSLKLLSHNNSKTNHNRHQTVTRCASSVSQYENTKCFVKNSNTISPLKRRTVSMLSVCSVGSSGRGSKQSLHDSNQHLWSHFEKQLLHKDLKRNSFRATSSTTVDFVLNPLFEGESSQSDGGADNENVNFSNSNLKKCENTHDDQAGDSGVDSCLNGFTGKEIKMGNENRKDFDKKCAGKNGSTVWELFNYVKVLVEKQS